MGRRPAMNMSEASYLIVWGHDGQHVHCMAECRHRLDAAVTAYLDTSRDSVVHLDLVDGGTYATLASSINSWTDSTPEIRANAVRQRCEREAEDTALEQTHNTHYWDTHNEE
jgi:hypothetical protein